MVDRDTLKSLDVNDTAYRNAGLPRDQMLKTGPDRFLGLSEFELAARYDHLIRDGGSSRIERLVKSTDGSSAMIEVHSRATCIDGHWIIIDLSLDMSDRKCAKLHAVQLQQMFSALSLTNEAILQTDTVHRLYQSACKAAVSCELFTIATILEPQHNGLFWAIATAENVDPDLKHIKIGNNRVHALEEQSAVAEEVTPNIVNIQALS